MPDPLTPLERKSARSDLASALAELRTYHGRLMRMSMSLSQLVIDAGAAMEMAETNARLLIEDTKVDDALSFASSVTRATTPDKDAVTFERIADRPQAVRAHEPTTPAARCGCGAALLAEVSKQAGSCTKCRDRRPLLYAAADRTDVGELVVPATAIDPRIVPGCLVRVKAYGPAGHPMPTLCIGENLSARAGDVLEVACAANMGGHWLLGLEPTGAIYADRVDFHHAPVAESPAAALAVHVVPMESGTLPGEAEDMDADDRLAYLDRELTDAELTEAALHALHYDIRNGTSHVVGLDPIAEVEARHEKLKAVLASDPA